MSTTRPRSPGDRGPEPRDADPMGRPADPGPPGADPSRSGPGSGADPSSAAVPPVPGPPARESAVADPGGGAGTPAPVVAVPGASEVSRTAAAGTVTASTATSPVVTDAADATGPGTGPPATPPPASRPPATPDPADARSGDRLPGDARPDDTQASGTGPPGTGPSGTGPSGTGPSGTRPSNAGPSNAQTQAQAQASDAIGSAPVAAGPGTVRRISLRDAPGVVPLARDFARQALHDWGWLPARGADRRAAAEDVLLVVSELVTNACLHAEGPEDMTIGFGGKVLRVEVTDRGAGSPAPRTPHRAGRPGGHGMFIVQRLCLDWGVVRTPGISGKTVWAELGAPG